MTSSPSNTATPSTPYITTNQNPTNQNNPTSPISKFVQSITKLKKRNFLVWRTQVEPFLLGHDLYGFIDGTNSSPKPDTSTSPDGSLTISTNPETK
jgi:hypothetical protein